MLIDTSAWAEFYKPVPNNSPDKEVNLAIKQIIRNHVLADKLLYTCPLIVQEVLQGAINTKELHKLTLDLQSVEFLTMDNQFMMAEKAADLYRQCRTKGITVRKSNDYLIAHFALHFNLPLLHKDRDFDHIAKVFPLKVVPIASLPNP